MFNSKHYLFISIINDWPPGLTGVSSGVFSVISDYIISMPNILPSDSTMMNQKYIQLAGDPWTNENPRETHQLQMCLIACLIKVNMSCLSTVYCTVQATMFCLSCHYTCQI